MKRFFLSLTTLFIVFLACAQTHVSFSDLEHWTTRQLQAYVGQTVIFDQPVYTCNNYRGTITASMHRVMSPTNQALPGTTEYNTIVSVNNSATFTLNGLHSGSDRMGQVIYGMKAKINSTGSVTVQSYDSIWGTRTDMLRGIPNLAYVANDGTVTQPAIIVCGANLEYYLTEQFGTGSSSSMGPSNASEHQKQRNKVSTALAFINADIYGLVEVQQGQGALAEIAADRTTKTGRHFTYITDKSTVNGTYTKSGYVYCSDVVRPFGQMVNNAEGV